MPPNQEQFNAQQERVRKLAESYEGPEKKEVAELYVDRIGKIKTAIMDSQLSDNQKEDYLKRLDSYLRLVDANNIQRLKKEYEPLLRSMESTLPLEVQDKAQDDREAQLEDVEDLKIRQELLGEWRETTKFKERYESKKKQIELLVKTKGLDPKGTELQYYMTAIEFHDNFLNTKLQEYYDAKDVGQKHEKLKDIQDQEDAFYDVLTQLEKRLQAVNSQDDLRVIDINDRDVLAEQMMFVKRKKYEEAKVKLNQQIEAMRIPKDDPLRQQIELQLQAADTQFDVFKDDVLTAKTPEERTVAAEQANELLDQANSIIEGAYKWLKAVDVKNSAVRGFSLVKIIESEKCPEPVAKFFKATGLFLMPQFAVGLGYYQAAQQGMSTSDKVLEVTDFGISLVPIVGGAYDIFASIRGKTLSGRQMGTTERVVRGVIGAGSIVLDIFTFGVGGTLAKAGGKAAIKAGAEITAKATAKAALEATGKVAAKEGTELLVKEGTEVGAHALAEGATKEAVGVATKEVAEGAAKEVGEKMTVALTKEQKEIIFKGMQQGASAAERSAARSVLKDMIHESLKASAKELGEKQAAKLAEQTAKIATRKTAGVAGWGFRKLAGFTGGKFGTAGMEGLEKGILRAGAEKSTVEAALKAGKKVVGPYYLQAKFVKEGEVLWGGMAKSVGKDAAKAWFHMHDPREVLKILEGPGKFLKNQFRRFAKGVPGNLFMNKEALEQIEQSSKATLIADGHDAKVVDSLFEEVKQKPWNEFMKENENNPVLKDPDVQEFFKSFQEQFPKSFTKQGVVVVDLYRGFKDLEPDAFVSAKMTYDSRRMEWKDFAEKYKDNLREATPEQLQTFEKQFENLHSMDREMPVNVEKIKHEREALKNETKLSKEKVAELKKELDALKDEKTQVNDILEKYEEFELHAPKGLTEADRCKFLSELYEKLPGGPLKESLNETRESIIQQASKEIKEGTEEFQEATAEAMRSVLPKRVMDIDERILVKANETGDAEVIAQVRKNIETGSKTQVSIPPLKQKGNVVELGERRAKEAEAAAEVDARKVEEARAAKEARKEEARKAKEAKNAPIVPIETATLARDIIKKRLMTSIPDDLKRTLSPQQLENLRTTVGSKGKTAAMEAVTKLGPKAKEAEVRAAAEKAFDEAAAKEVEVARKAVKEGKDYLGRIDQAA